MRNNVLICCSLILDYDLLKFLFEFLWKNILKNATDERKGLVHNYMLQFISTKYQGGRKLKKLVVITTIKRREERGERQRERERQTDRQTDRQTEILTQDKVFLLFADI